MTAESIAVLVATGLAAGVLAGLLGVGGGILMVPAMVLLLGYGQHVAQGTSLLVIIPAALVGSWSHHRHGRFAMRDAAALALGGIVGAMIGSLTALSIEGEALRRVFALFLLVSGLRIVLTKTRVQSSQ